MSTHHGILIHTVFSTKLRMKVIRDEWRDDLFAYLGSLVRQHDGFLAKAGGIEDHVHLLLRVHPKLSNAIKNQPLSQGGWYGCENTIAGFRAESD